MVSLHDKASGAKLADITDAQFQFMMDQLEEESSRDQDYFIDSATIHLLADAGAEPSLLDVLRQALGDRDGIDIRWSRR